MRRFVIALYLALVPVVAQAHPVLAPVVTPVRSIVYAFAVSSGAHGTIAIIRSADSPIDGTIVDVRETISGRPSTVQCVTYGFAGVFCAPTASPEEMDLLSFFTRALARVSRIGAMTWTSSEHGLDTTVHYIRTPARLVGATDIAETRTYRTTDSATAVTGDIVFLPTLGIPRERGTMRVGGYSQSETITYPLEGAKS